MRAHVLVPLKRLDVAKTRLADALGVDERAQLMRSLLDGVLAAVRDADVGPVTIVTGEQLDGAEVFDDRGLPWNEALEAAMREIVREEIAAIVSADLPFLTAEEVRALVDKAHCATEIAPRRELVADHVTQVSDRVHDIGDAFRCEPSQLMHGERFPRH